MKGTEMTAGYSQELRDPVLVLEDDASLAKIIRKELHDEGLNEVDWLDNGDEAWKNLSQKKYTFLLLDWKVPGMSSLTLLNRIKEDKYYRSVPVLVMSGYLQHSDFSLFSEFGNVGAIEKPFAGNFLLRKLKSIRHEATWFQKQAKKIQRAVEKIHEIPEQKKNKIVTDLLDSAPNPVPVAIILGKELRLRKEWRLSELALRWGLRYSDTNVVILSEMGKLYLEQGSLKKAKTFLGRADKASPKNLERICDLGDIHLKELNTQQAEELYERALEIDPEDKTAKDGQLVSGHMGKWLATTVSVPDTFAGILNAVGVGMVRSGDFSQGIEYYSSALGHVGSDRLKSRLAFNVGLAYLRWKKSREAMKWLKKSSEFDPENDKSRTYIQKIKEASGRSGSDAGELLTPEYASEGSGEAENPGNSQDSADNPEDVHEDASGLLIGEDDAEDDDDIVGII